MENLRQIHLIKIFPLPFLCLACAGDTGVTNESPSPALQGLTVQWGRQTCLQTVRDSWPEEDGTEGVSRVRGRQSLPGPALLRELRGSSSSPAYSAESHSRGCQAGLMLSAWSGRPQSGAQEAREVQVRILASLQMGSMVPEAQCSHVYNGLIISIARACCEG